MTSSTVTLSISFSESTDISSSGSCTETEVENINILHVDVDSQGAWSGADGHCTFRNPLLDEGLGFVQRNHCMQNSLGIGGGGSRGIQEHPSFSQSIRGSRPLDRNFIYAVEGGGGANQKVLLHFAFHCSKFWMLSV